MIRNMVTKFLLFVVLVVVPDHFVSGDNIFEENEDEEYITNESQDSLKPKRVKISPFVLELVSGEETNLTTHEQLIVVETSEEILHSSLRVQMEVHNVTVDFVKLHYKGMVNNNDPEERRRRLTESSTLQFDGGLVSFRTRLDDDPISVEGLDDIIASTLEADLADTLKLDTELNSIQEAIYHSQNPTAVVGGAQRNFNSNAASGKTVITWSIVGLVTGACLIILFAIYAVRKDRKTTTTTLIKEGTSSRAIPMGTIALADLDDNDEEDDHREATTSVDDEEEASYFTYDDDSAYGYSSHYHDHQVVSRQGSLLTCSDWTASSDAAFTLRSGKLFPRSNHSLMQTESFERDRQDVMLKKEMIQTSWASAIPLGRDGWREARSSVLQPSHFTPTGGDGRPSYAFDDELTNTSGSDVTPPFFFETSEPEGEEVVLMPPSQLHSRRRGLV